MRSHTKCMIALTTYLSNLEEENRRLARENRELRKASHTLRTQVKRIRKSNVYLIYNLTAGV